MPNAAVDISSLVQQIKYDYFYSEVMEYENI